MSYDDLPRKVKNKDDWGRKTVDFDLPDCPINPLAKTNKERSPLDSNAPVFKKTFDLPTGIVFRAPCGRIVAHFAGDPDTVVYCGCGGQHRIREMKIEYVSVYRRDA